MSGDPVGLSVVIPTYQRGTVVLESARALLALQDGPDEILIVDQTGEHEAHVLGQLEQLARDTRVRWLRLAHPSIPHAMNVGLLEARGPVVLFLDDDILPQAKLVQAHRQAQSSPRLVAGQVLHPGQEPYHPGPEEGHRFDSCVATQVYEFMGGNFSVDRGLALALGGFDENFIGAAYRFEAEFAARYVQRHGPMEFEPRASIRHLAVASGGTRAHGHHLRTSRPAHSTGAYYFLLRVRPPGWWIQALVRPLRAVRTRHHLRQPWWIPATLVAEARGMLQAWRLHRSGPRLLSEKPA